jgi:3',5'-cyclic AMP phosphodiesterase CpdA
MRALLQISDPHFGTEQPPVLHALQVLSRNVKPELVVVSGDITQRARRTQFAAARAFIEQLHAAHVVSIPGNHDIPLFNVFARLFHPYSNYSREFGHNLEPLFEDEDALIICVNTTRPKRHKDGEVSEQQIQRVAARLRGASERQLRVVVTHQPVHVIDDHDIQNLLHGRDAAVREWSAAGVDLILGGHIHLPHVFPLSDRYPKLPRKGWTIQAGTAVSHRVRNNVPNSVNVIRPSFPVCLVERWDFSASDAAFILKSSHSLELARS